MKAHFVTFGTDEFAQSLEYSLDAARSHFATVRSWRWSDLRRTPFYRSHQLILDQSRGAGYWLWKPFIIRERLRESADGDVVMYLDAGAMVIADPAPLIELCAQEDVLVFAGHYALPGCPDICGVWTKRDCFVRMRCDAPRYHEAPMADASVFLAKKSARGLAFVEDWLSFATDPAIIADSPNSCGLTNLPGFIDHRHDQSILSLLAARDQLPLHRGPSQLGNHCKAPSWRVPGEWLRDPYGSAGVFSNSPYGTIVLHHRRRAILTSKVNPRGSVQLRRVAERIRGLPGVNAPVGGVSEESLLPNITYVEAFLSLCDSLDPPHHVLALGGIEPEAVRQISTYLPREAVVVALRTHDEIPHCRTPFNAIIGSPPTMGLPAFAHLMDLGLLAHDFVICVTTIDRDTAFDQVVSFLRPHLGERLAVHHGFARDASYRQIQVVGLAHTRAVVTAD